MRKTSYLTARSWCVRLQPLWGYLLSNAQKFDTGIGYDKIDIKHPKQDETHNLPLQSLKGGLLNKRVAQIFCSIRKI